MSSQNYWADNLRILQWMISDVNEEKTVLHDIKSSFCYHVLEQKYLQYYKVYIIYPTVYQPYQKRSVIYGSY